MLIEKDFFAPNIAGDLGSSLESAQELQTKLQNFEPIAQVEQSQRTMLAAMTTPIVSQHSSVIDYYMFR